MTKKTILAAGGLVLNEKNEVLLIFRRGKWDLPKGKLDAHETIEQCAVREVKEETGLQTIEVKQFLCTTYHEYFDTYVNEIVIKESWWYLMKALSTEKLIPQTSEDIEQIIWADELKTENCMKNSYSNIVEIIAMLKK